MGMIIPRSNSGRVKRLFCSPNHPDLLSPTAYYSIANGVLFQEARASS